MSRIPLPPAGRWLAGAIAGLVAAVALPAACLAQDAPATLVPGSLTVCIYPEFPPAAYRDDSGTWRGWDIDFITAFAASESLTFEPVVVDSFGGMWRLPGEDKCDVAASAITVTPERRQDSPGAAWSDPYFASERILVVRAGDETLIRRVEDLAGRTVAVTKDTTGDLDLRRRIEAAGVTDVNIVYTPGEAHAVAAVLGGDVFAFATDQTGGDYMMEREGGLAMAWPHPTLNGDGSETAEQFSFVVRTASSGLLDALNAYIAENDAAYGGNK